MLIRSKPLRFFNISQEICNHRGRGYVHCIWHIVANRLISIIATFGEKGFPRKYRNFCFGEFDPKLPSSCGINCL
ncbi:hypothetical protein T10_2516 [Trichinella papuae]|uniref:Uncharacterized protein n=1 Tax=Trichinella papuae TaxID=268474 RepID=A0A0V1M0J1_9BILA|nr:hypothetical protein T10_2516 [Trichinella papuae]